MKDSGIQQVGRTTISNLWGRRHDDPMLRRMLRATINDAQRYRKMFRKLPKKTGKK